MCCRTFGPHPLLLNILGNDRRRAQAGRLARRAACAKCRCGTEFRQASLPRDQDRPGSDVAAVTAAALAAGCVRRRVPARQPVLLLIIPPALRKVPLVRDASAVCVGRDTFGRRGRRERGRQRSAAMSCEFVRLRREIISSRRSKSDVHTSLRPSPRLRASQQFGKFGFSNLVVCRLLK
jgi:hypothetical protein